MKSTQLMEEHPWDKSWWYFSEGNGPVLFFLILIHALALVGLILFPLPSLGTFLVALVIATLGGVGTSVCYHRSLSHRALRLNPAVEQFLIFFAIYNASGEPVSWTAKHRHHHAKADTEEDVSSPRHGGFWWAHIRWIYQWSGSEASRWCPDLDKPRYRVWDRLQIPIIALSICSGLLMGWEGFFWIGAIRLVYSLHFQMMVNSLLHMTPGLEEGADTSRNIWWLGPFQLGAWGENWHRNHHSDANAAKFSRDWRQIDLGWYIICALKALRLASAIREGKEQVRKQARRAA
jgi:stearoyl-CoA desaturase (delta-9 desaturase)